MNALEVNTSCLDHAQVLTSPLGDEVVVLDDFYRRPEAAAQHARARTTTEDVPFFGKSRTLSDDELASPVVFFAGLLGGLVEAYSFFARVSDTRSVPHVDTLPIACTIYLNDDVQIGGTSLYRHKTFGSYRVPFKNGHLSYESEHTRTGLTASEYREAHSRPRDAWEKYFTVPMKFNRAVFYSAGLYHNSDFPENSYSEFVPRITQNIFLCPSLT